MNNRSSFGGATNDNNSSSSRKNEAPAGARGHPPGSASTNASSASPRGGTMTTSGKNSKIVRGNVPRRARWSGHQTAIDTLLAANPPIRLRPSEDQNQINALLQADPSLGMRETTTRVGGGGASAPAMMMNSSSSGIMSGGKGGDGHRIAISADAASSIIKAGGRNLLGHSTMATMGDSGAGGVDEDDEGLLNATISLDDLSATLAVLKDNALKEELLARAQGRSTTPPIVKEHRGVNERKEKLLSDRHETTKLEERLLSSVEKSVLTLEGEAIQKLSQTTRQVSCSRRGLALPYPWYGEALTKIKATMYHTAKKPYVDLARCDQLIQPPEISSSSSEDDDDVLLHDGDVETPLVNIHSGAGSSAGVNFGGAHYNSVTELTEHLTEGQEVLRAKKELKKRAARERKQREKEQRALDVHSPTQKTSDVKLGKLAMMKVHTASTVALLWRMLEQVSGPVAGMSNALNLFKDLLHVIYEDFGKDYKDVEEVPEPSLAAQIAQLAKLKLHAASNAELEVDCCQLATDVDFYAKAMENWGFQIWRQGKLATRRKEAFMIRLEKVVREISATKRKEIAFSQWKEYVHHRKVTSKIIKFEAELRSLDPNGTEYSRHTPGNSASSTSNNNNNSSTKTVDKKSSRSTRSGEKSASSSSHIGGSSDDLARRNGDSQQRRRRSSSGSAASEGGRGEEDPLPLLLPTTVESKLNAITKKMKSLEDVNGVLRAQVSIYRKKVSKLTQDNSELKSKLRASEEKEVDLLNQLLSAKNELQEKEESIHKLRAEVARLSNKVRLQDHRRWRSAALGVVETLCGVRSAKSKEIKQLEQNMLKESQLAASRNAALGIPTTTETDFGGNNSNSGLSSALPTLPSSQAPMFPRPVLNRNCFVSMANPIETVQDWVNRCLDELGSLEQSGTWHSQRLTEFSTELRDGTIASRLLFYLSLPRYEAADDEAKLPEASRSSNANRQRLLLGSHTQTKPPFPTYNDAFGDLSRQSHLQRNTTVLDFAQSLISGAQTRSVGGGGGSTPPPLPGLGISSQKLSAEEQASMNFPLLSIVSPADLTDGNRNSALSFFAILYCCFAHPFNHKTDEELLKEPAHHKQLCTQLNSALVLNDERADQATVLTTELSPPVTSESHMELLEGHFWSEESLVESESLRALITVVAQLNQSLQQHKWTVAASCLLPLSTSASLFRFGNRPALLTGGAAIQSGLIGSGFSFDHLSPSTLDDEAFTIGELDGKRRDKLIIDPDRLHHLLQCRNEASPNLDYAEDPKPVADVLDALKKYGQDLVGLFMRYSVISVVMGTRCMGIKEWRTMWAEAGNCASKIGIDVLMNIFLHCQTDLLELKEMLPKPGTLNSGSGGGGGTTPGATSLLPLPGGLGGDDDDTKSVVSKFGAGGLAAPSEMGGQSMASKFGMNTENWRAIQSYEMLFEDFVEGVLRVAAQVTKIGPPLPTPGTTGGGSSGATSRTGTPQEVPLLSNNSLQGSPKHGMQGAAGSGRGLNSLLGGGAAGSFSVSRAGSPNVGTGGFSLGGGTTKLSEGVVALISTKLLNIPKQTDYSTFVEAVQRADCRKVLHRKMKEISSVFSVYSKNHKGKTSMDMNDLLKVAKEAGWITHELTSTMLQDLALECLNGRDSLRLIPLQDAEDLMSDPFDRLMSERDFVHILLVLCCYKYPSPLQPLHKKIEVFLNKNVMEALKSRPTTYARTHKTGASTGVSTGGGWAASGGGVRTPAPPGSRMA